MEQHDPPIPASDWVTLPNCKVTNQKPINQIRLFFPTYLYFAESFFIDNDLQHLGDNTSLLQSKKKKRGYKEMLPGPN